jgi:hypothetical protein
MGDGTARAVGRRMQKRLSLLPLVLLAACADGTIDDESVPMLAPETAPAVPEEPLADSASLTFQAPELPAAEALTGQEDEGPFDPSDVHPDEPKISFTAPSRPVPVWSSLAGRTYFADALVASGTERPSSVRNVLPQFRANKDVCVEPKFMTGSQTIGLPGGRKLKAPSTAFATAADAKAYLETVYAAMPMYKPFTRANIKLGGGWLYNNGGSHRALDYSRTDVDVGDDPTFIVRSVAPGTVIEVGWGEGGGNRVVVEHVAPNGLKYVTQYLHLRDGKSHDLALAKAIDCTGKESRCPKYVEFAKNYSNHVSWGTDAHKIMVKVGDKVNAHTALAYAGNTGYGGAGWGLNDDGSPESHKGNTHLHLYSGAQHPTEPQNFVMIDPYGVYDQESSGCYDLLEDTLFDRLFAPFYPSFHDLPLEVLLTYFGYYAKMGMSPKTLVVYNGDDGTAAAGSFRSGLGTNWRTRINYDGAGFQSWFETYRAQGLVPRETSVRESSGGLRYTATWRPVRANERWEHWGSMTDSVFAQKWQANVIAAGWRVESYLGYMSGGSPRHAALFTSDTPRPFYLYQNRPFAELQGLINGNFANGYAPVDLNAVDLPSGRRYSAILRKEPGCWAWAAGLDSAGYQAKFSELSGKGFSLWKVQAYGDDDDPTFLGVWRADTCP